MGLAAFVVFLRRRTRAAMHRKNGQQAQVVGLQQACLAWKQVLVFPLQYTILSLSLACGRALSLRVWRGRAAGTADALLREGLLLEDAAALGALAKLAIPAGLVRPLPGLRGGLGDFALADSSVGALAAQGRDPFLQRATMKSRTLARCGFHACRP